MERMFFMLVLTSQQLYSVSYCGVEKHYSCGYVRKDYLSILLKAAQHDNALALALPNHPPKVLHGGGQWALGGNVGPSLPIALLCYMKSIEVYKCYVRQLTSTKLALM